MDRIHMTLLMILEELKEINEKLSTTSDSQEFKKIDINDLDVSKVELRLDD